MPSVLYPHRNKINGFSVLIIKKGKHDFPIRELFEFLGQENIDQNGVYHFQISGEFYHQNQGMVINPSEEMQMASLCVKTRIAY